MKKAKKAKARAKAKKPRLSASAVRDLELMDPAAKQVKGGGPEGRAKKPGDRY